MIELPAALASWKPALAAFAPDLAVALAPFVDRIALAIGSLSTTSKAGVGEPDGYGGLTRRGSYERLVGSEWLLAQELPDEFLRRAGAGEHLFVEIAARVPAGGRRCVALFDAGPMQLGGPRIGHLATLIALSQRAERAATRFAWGILQQPDADPVEDVTEASVLRLLHGRTSEIASSEHVDRWREKLALTASDDVWIVGDGSLAESRGSRIAVHESIEVGARRVSIAVKRRDGRAAEVILDLPAHDDCARLLRDPFTVITAMPRSASQLGSAPSSNPVYGQDGRRVVVRLRDGGVACMPVPSSPRQTPGTPTIFRPREGEVVVAAGSHGKKLAVVTVDPSDRVVVLRSIGKMGGVRAEKRFGPLPDDIKMPVAGAELGQCIRVGRGLIGAEFVLCTDGERQLFHLSADDPVWGPHVEALTLQDTRPRYIAAGGNPRRRRIWQWESDLFKPVGPSFDLLSSPAAFFGWGGTQWREIIALQEANGWHVGYCDPKDKWRGRQLHPSAGDRVVGVTSSGVDGCLVLLDEDRRRLSLVSFNTSKVLQSSSDIAHVTVSDRRPELAYVTVAGELVVVHTRSGETLLRFCPEPTS
ncbi:MAG: hypothetical protein JWM53_354 [bacterium]|nr:hypothetical protein [bacterium]